MLTNCPVCFYIYYIMKAKLLKDHKEFNYSAWEIVEIEITKKMPEKFHDTLWKYIIINWKNWKRTPLLKEEDVEILRK